MNKSEHFGWKGWLVAAGGFLSILISLGVVHAKFVVPAIIQDCREEMRRMIDDHAAHPHSVSIGTREFKIAIDGINARLERIERKIDR